MPSSVLAETCFVINREEDPIKGFQRELDLKRAQEIANYIDNGLGTIPSAIVLSAQEDAEFEYNSKTKTLNFKPIKKAFLIIDVVNPQSLVQHIVSNFHDLFRSRAASPAGYGA